MKPTAGGLLISARGNLKELRFSCALARDWSEDFIPGRRATLRSPTSMSRARAAKHSSENRHRKLPVAARGAQLFKKASAGSMDLKTAEKPSFTHNGAGQ